MRKLGAKPRRRKAKSVPGPGTHKVYRAYFFRGHDPAIDEVKRFVGEHSLSSIEKDGGPAASTVGNWFKGKTKRPQNATLEAAGRALGMRRVWIPLKDEEDKGK